MRLELLRDPNAAERWCAEQRAAGKTLGFVPTMGALHDGHLSLVRRAVAENDLACVSVFVNPLQFDEASDLESYPRDLEGDAHLLEGVGCAMAFTGALAEFFPGRLDAAGALEPESWVDPGPGAAGLEGACRTGHFEGVATIVQRLFELVGPTRAYFGQKDFQQTLVVRELARRAGEPQVVVCPTAREDHGLARSSRNERLSPEVRRRAACLAHGLSAAAEAWQSGERRLDVLEALLRAPLQIDGVELEYAAVRDARAWTEGPPAEPLGRPVAVVAARFGDVRLIDNHELDQPAPLAAGPSRVP